MEEKSKFLRTYVLQDFETFVKIHPDRSRHVFWRGGMFKTYVHMSHSPNTINQIYPSWGEFGWECNSRVMERVRWSTPDAFINTRPM